MSTILVNLVWIAATFMAYRSGVMRGERLAWKRSIRLINLAIDGKNKQLAEEIRSMVNDG